MMITKLERAITREKPLVLTDVFLKGYFDIEKIFKIKMPKTFILFTRGTAMMYRDSRALNEVLPREFSKLIKEQKNKDKIYKACFKTVKAVNFYKKLKEILKNNKDISLPKLMKYLSQIRKLHREGYPGLFLAFWVGNWQEDFHNTKNIQLFDRGLIDDMKNFRKGPMDIFSNISVELIYFILKQIASVKKWPFNLMKYLTYQELQKFITNKDLPVKILEKRKNEDFGYSNRIIYKPNIKEELKRLNIALKEPKIKKTKEIKGTIANKGRIKGIVRLVFSREQLSKVKRGDVLVAPMTTPWYLPAVKKASAIITDEGGLTCHAAIVAREMNKPCVIGIKYATRVLGDGDLVEVDANKGIVRKLKNT